MTFFLSKIRNSKFAIELLSLHGVQIGNIIIPLVMLPILGRSLGLESYGRYVIIYSIIVITSLIIEYGMSFSATRMIAQSIDSPEQRNSIVSKFIGAKILLSIFFISVFIIFASLKNEFFNAYEVLIIISGTISLGWAPNWYFQGKGNLAQFAIFDVMIKCLSVVMMFMLIDKPEDLHLALLITIVSSLISCIYGNIKIFKDVGRIYLSFSKSISIIIQEKDMAIYRILSSSIGNTNAIFLGTFAGATVAATYSSAERLATGSRFFITPFNQIFFARISRYSKSNIMQAKREFVLSLSILLSLSGLLIIVGWFAAPSIISIFLGKEFADSVDILRYLLLLTPLYVVGNTLSMQWMVPLGMDRQYNIIVASSAVISVILMSIVIPIHGAGGVVFVVGFVEFLICLMMMIYLTKFQKSPFSNISMMRHNGNGGK
ncbi:oligosaccharide flippase family protein [Deinococcus sp. 6YEL10]|uniref:lipopolysaccharide biosynthesis protein n=1 Tax=Deinococcus sp. 6YEL10 TaxID=2745870 RepID=UPI0021036535|nr:oligosaccharide flippase family protein [Deinococcus sp. 6YEL10]MCD0160630.1 oligosaccharide flippase family protein [Deinococcus sp. 6YEL10]